MVRIVLCFLSLFLLAPVFAGEFEDALKTSDNVMLFLSSPGCSYCQKFDPIYRKTKQNYANKCKFVKVDVTTGYGRRLANNFKVMYVPFVILVKSSNKYVMQIDAKCLLDSACVANAMNSFIK